jgi:cystathionine beta-synthase
VVSVGPDDTLVAAYGRMKLYDVSQLPVLDKQGRLAGIIDETDILLQVVEDEARFAEPVRSAMTTRVETLPPTASTAELLPIFEKGMVGVVAEGDTFHGLITRIDLINYLRRRLRDA